MMNPTAYVWCPSNRRYKGISMNVASAASEERLNVRLMASQLSKANAPTDKSKPSRAPKAVATPFPPRKSKNTGYK